MSTELKQSIKDAIKQAERTMQRQKKELDACTVAYKNASRTLNTLLSAMKQLEVVPIPKARNSTNDGGLREAVMDVMKDAILNAKGPFHLSPAEVYERTSTKKACTKSSVGFVLQQLVKDGYLIRTGRAQYQLQDLDNDPKLPKLIKAAAKKKAAQKKKKAAPRRRRSKATKKG